MNLFTNFAGPVCLIATPTEKQGFVLVAVAFSFVLAFCLLSLVTYSIATQKWKKSSISDNWKAVPIASTVVLLVITLAGVVTGSTERSGYCNDGVWGGIQDVFIRIALFLLAVTLLQGLVLCVMTVYRIAEAIFNKKSSSKR